MADTILERFEVECGCKAGFGQADASTAGFVGGMLRSPDLSLQINGMLRNGLAKQEEDPDITIPDLRDHIATEDFTWSVGGGMSGTCSVRPEDRVQATGLLVSELAGRLAVCTKRMQRGECEMYALRTNEDTEE